MSASFGVPAQPGDRVVLRADLADAIGVQTDARVLEGPIVLAGSSVKVVVCIDSFGDRFVADAEFGEHLMPAEFVR